MGWTFSLADMYKTTLNTDKAGRDKVPGMQENDYAAELFGAKLQAIGRLTGASGLFQTAYWLTTRYRPDKKTTTILGCTDVVLQEITIKSDKTNTATDALTRTVDTTTYGDRALLTLKNDRGFNVYLTSIKLDGKRIYQYSGENGELLHDGLKNDSDIRRNGERLFEIGNRFVIDGTQVAKIADYWWKFCGQKKHVYSLSIPGFAYWYEIGEWYTLTLGSANTNEYIDSVVECYSVDCERAAGSIGSTNILFREVVENWSKTTLYAARLVSGGSPKRRVNRSNIVTVASSTYDGTYDYRCDGTADDVQIQAAIDYLSYTFGGGTVELTGGTFNTTNEITVRDNMLINGVGEQTIIDFVYGNVAFGAFTFTGTVGDKYTIQNLHIISDSSGIVASNNASIHNVSIASDDDINSGSAGILSNTSSAAAVLNCTVSTFDTAFNSVGMVTNCYSVASTNGFYLCESVTGSQADTCTTGFESCTGLIRNRAISCTTGFTGCTSMQQNKTITCGTKYSLSYADAGTSNACADTSSGGFNS